MAFKQADYISKTAGKAYREYLVRAVLHIKQRQFNAAIDCGCGSGNDI